MRKIYLPLTQDQKDRGVIFSSTLSRCKVEQPNDVIHEVFKDSSNIRSTIDRLMDDKFFNKNTIGWKYNIIRE